MSVEATHWAWNVEVKSSAQRLVLLSLADRAGEHHTAYPSNKRLAQDTCLNIKTVQKVINELIEMGLVKDTGKRMGMTNQVRVLQLTGVKSRESTQNRDSTKIGNVTEIGIVKEYQNRDSSIGVTQPILDDNTPKNGICNAPNFGIGNLPLNLSMNLSCEHEWIPNLDQLISVLKISGRGQHVKQIIELPSFEFELGSFNTHFESKMLSDSQKLYKFATWIIDKFERYQKQNPEYGVTPIPDYPEQKNQHAIAEPMEW